MMKRHMIIALLMGLVFQGSCSDSKKEGDGDTDSAGQDDSNANGATDSDGSGTENGGIPGFPACASQNIEIGLLPLDILLVLDTSYSMDYAPTGVALTKWDITRSAITRFIEDNNFDGAGLGLQFFPLRNLCSVDAYRTPAVPISPLPDAAPDLLAALNAQRMAAGTPMVPMLDGVLDYTQQWQDDNPDRRAVVILATDGIPDDTCMSSDETQSNTMENVVRLAEEAAASRPTVNTFVIGVGSELTPLNAISQAGNGEDAILVDMESDTVETELLDALETIRRRSVCEYDLSSIADGARVDFAKVNVLFSNSDVEEEAFVNVNVEQTCHLNPQGGWYYDDQEDPTTLIFCPETCGRVQAELGNQIQFILGCPTVIVE